MSRPHIDRIDTRSPAMQGFNLTDFSAQKLDQRRSHFLNSKRWEIFFPTAIR